jgi:hypothetical protein
MDIVSIVPANKENNFWYTRILAHDCNRKQLAICSGIALKTVVIPVIRIAPTLQYILEKNVRELGEPLGG